LTSQEFREYTEKVMNLLKFLQEVKRNNRAFTLIELLIVIGILAVLFAIVLFAINPQRQFEAARDTQRRSDVNAILNAVYQYTADNKGALPPAITAVSSDISNSGIDLCATLAPTYIAQIPTDPSAGSYTSCAAYDTKYNILKTAANRVTVSATLELGGTFSVTR